MSDQLLTIGELARRTRLAPSALRYYEELGLLAPARRVSGQRRYPPSAVETVGVILFLRDVGFSLAETRTLMASRAESPAAWRELVRRKVTELDEQIAKAAPPASRSTTPCVAASRTCSNARTSGMSWRRA